MKEKESSGRLSPSPVALIDNLPASIEHIRSARLRPLAVTTVSRSHALPEVPALSEVLSGYEASAWTVVGAPKNTPTEIIQRLNQEINTGLNDSSIKARLVDLGAVTFSGSPADLGKFIVEETEKWGKVIRAANIKAE